MRNTENIKQYKKSTSLIAAFDNGDYSTCNYNDYVKNLDLREELIKKDFYVFIESLEKDVKKQLPELDKLVMIRVEDSNQFTWFKRKNKYQVVLVFEPAELKEDGDDYHHQLDYIETNIRETSKSRLGELTRNWVKQMEVDFEYYTGDYSKLWK